MVLDTANDVDEHPAYVPSKSKQGQDDQYRLIFTTQSNRAAQVSCSDPLLNLQAMKCAFQKYVVEANVLIDQWIAHYQPLSSVISFEQHTKLSANGSTDGG